MSAALITSLQNPRIKNLVKLRSGNHRRRQRKFVIEGLRELQRALQCDWPVEALFYCPGMLSGQSFWDTVHRIDAMGIECVQVSENIIQKCAFRENPDGLLALADFRDHGLDQLELGPNPLLLVVESVEKPGNIGALLRTADAAGVDAVLFCDPVTDLYNPNAVRASQGAFFSATAIVTDSTTARLWLEEKGVRTVATSPGAAKKVWQHELTGPLALVVGAEDTGLSADWLNDDITAVSLPMKGVTDSLNVSVAAAVILFEALRQRDRANP